ncbi:uncharacterized protein LOC128994315 isoform X1 [Macrosteles quadrilineatus]|uniref:uncharacterized protein LOC128994315 isoform X1 n=1 Tax=Macrosteles quadrilineatus TaxID=74068 RepID=UPI0023E0A2F1|nr:uncharacterized protein LOC128994315 isoform X1 [Macrosteles quadrilineatus]
MNYVVFFGVLTVVNLSMLTGTTASHSVRHSVRNLFDKLSRLLIYRHQLVKKEAANHLRNEGTSSHGVTTNGANTDTPFAAMAGKVYKVDAFVKDDKGKKLISIAATKKKFKMACLPLPEARQHCATKTKETHLHYVELLDGPDFFEAYCTSDPSVVLDNVKHLCSSYSCGNSNACTMVYLFKIRVNKGDKEECKIKGFASLNQNHGEDDCPTQSQSSSLLDECKAKKGMLSPEDMAWNKEANIESLCKVEDAPTTNSALEPAPAVGMS